MAKQRQDSRFYTILFTIVFLASFIRNDEGERYGVVVVRAIFGPIVEPALQFLRQLFGV